MQYLSYLSSPLGTLTLGSDGTALTMLQLRKLPLQPGQILTDNLPVWGPVQSWLDAYWQGQNPGTCPVSLRPAGTGFQKQIWKLLMEIPYGRTVTYGQLAAMAGRSPLCSQAVGGAVGRNPIALLIPCHRVVGRGGRLTGYAYGLSAKKYLLDLERAGFQSK